MKRKNIFKKKHKYKYKKWVLLFAIMLGICSFGVTYAAWTDSGQMGHNVTTKIMDFIFSSEYKDDFRIYLINSDVNAENVSKGVSELEATITYSGKTLDISGVEAFAMSKLLSGTSSIGIDYRLEASDLQNGLLQIAGGDYDLGIIPFELSVEEPYWRVSNENGQWGVGNTKIGIPSAVYELLPKSLGELHAYNTITAYNDGVIDGTIIIKQLLPITKGVVEINLSSLKLSNKINQEIVANKVKASSLEIMANYNFSIPLVLEPIKAGS